MSNILKIGQVIKSYRVRADESIEDLSGAVEVEPEFISDIETGNKLPPEDILALIISHLDIEDNKANEIWQLAGYKEVNEDNNMPKDDDNQQININVPADKPILYTDMVHVVSNNYGVVLNFVQRVGDNGQAQVVSRVGMSPEHAKSVLEVLKKSIDKPTN